ncbi:ATP-binding cassette domain-containing protein [bacterium]|nr:ATP-binding cassette domain-containing protein [bacterium]
MIEAIGVTKQFRGDGTEVVTAVDNVSLSIFSQQIVVLTGESGSGKTSLLSILGALSRPTSGAVHILGRDVNNCSGVELARIRRHIGFVFQSFSLLPRLPAWENVTWPLIPLGVPQARRFDLAGQMLERVGLRRKSESRPEQLSGGEQQRVAVARALVASPRILLADEPTSNLDTRAAERLIEIFREIHTDGVTLVFSTHDPRLIALGTQVFEMRAGQLKCV